MLELPEIDAVTVTLRSVTRVGRLSSRGTVLQLQQKCLFGIEGQKLLHLSAVSKMLKTTHTIYKLFPSIVSQT